MIFVVLAVLASPAAAFASTAPFAEGPSPDGAARVGPANVSESPLAGVSEREHFPTAVGAVSARLALRLLELRFPIPADTGEGKRIVYSNTRQRVWLVDEAGSLVDTYLISGRRGVPRSGSYRVYSKSEKAWAGHDGITMRFMVRFTRSRTSGLGIGFHEIPLDRRGRPMQTEHQLDTYRSGGCVRQSTSKAIFLYGWADIGTSVVVIT